MKVNFTMNQSPLNNQTPQAFVTVIALLEEGRATLAMWTGHSWWGEQRELVVKAWQAFSAAPVPAREANAERR